MVEKAEEEKYQAEAVQLSVQGQCTNAGLCSCESFMEDPVSNASTTFIFLSWCNHNTLGSPFNLYG